LIEAAQGLPELDGLFQVAPGLEIDATAAGSVSLRTPATCLIVDDPDGAVARVLASLAEWASVEQVARSSGVSSEFAGALVSSLYSQGFVVDASDCEHPAGLFLDHLRASGRSRERELGGARALMGAWRGAPAALALGFLIEEWHHVRATPVLIRALLSAPGPLEQRDRWMALIESEREAEHAVVGPLLEACRAAQLDPAQPLPAGRALRAALLKHANRNTLDYLACSAPFGHSREGLEGKLAFLGALPAHGAPEAVVEPFLERARAFLTADLDVLVTDCFLAGRSFDGPRRRELLACLCEHVERCDQFYLELLSTYGPKTAVNLPA
jgi:hypothetical protein